jgi:tRNA modification GTPase
MASSSDLSTIAALATAPAPAGIAVIRVSGTRTRQALKVLFRSKASVTEHPRTLQLGRIIDHETGAEIDTAMAVFMPGPHSYTGEDVAEFQFHGSPALVQKVLRSLFAYGISPAEAGEFTKRAFLNGKIDLVQAEAVSDLVNATSDEALRLANEQLKGRFSEIIDTIGEPLRNTLAEIEARIDFPDEDIEPHALDALIRVVSDARTRMEDLLNTYQYGQVIRDGFRVLLCGKPNAGKSSLLNELLGTERAIVTPVSGTTRDLIEESATFAGFRFVFCDSAGLTDSQDPVEKIGIELARERLAWADLVLFVVDAADTDASWRAVLETIRPKARKIWMVTNKIDLNPSAFASFFCDSSICAQNFYLSVKTRNGFDALVDALVEEVKASSSDKSHANQVVTNERHRICLTTSYDAVTRSLTALQTKMPTELVASELRIALNAMEELVGKTYTEDILGRIFSKFCIGK